MPKRFTDPDKWNDPWFQELSFGMKLLWLFLCDRCDFAGIWKANKRMVEFMLDTTMDWAQVTKTFSGRVFEKDGYWFIPKFLTFQYGAELNYGNCIKSAIKRISERGFSDVAEEQLGNPYRRVAEGFGKGWPTLLSKSKSMSKSKDVKKLTLGGVGDFEKLWLSYPRRLGRKAAERSFRGSVKAEKDWLDIQQALANYLTYIRKQAVDPQYIKHGSTWFNSWRDWVDYQEAPNAPNGSPSAVSYAAIARAKRESSSPRKNHATGAVSHGGRDLHALQDETEPGNGGGHDDPREPLQRLRETDPVEDGGD